MERMDRRGDAQPRPLTLIPNFVETADGSCLITAGKTRVICTASVEEGVPPFLRGEGRGWVTAEYAMLPASTGRRKARDGIKKDGRGVEIQRLIGRSLRQAVDMRLLGERTITLDCDVLQADGGTRTASITGAYVALVMAVHKLMQNGLIAEQSHHRAGGGHQRGRGGRTAHAGPVLSGGQPRPDRHEPGDEPAGRVHRIAGYGRGKALHQPRAGPSFWTWAARACAP